MRLTLLALVTRSAFALGDGGGSASRAFDLLVIGSGSAGLQAAKVAARFGKSVAIIEKQPVFGGDCTWTGCVPSKTLLASAKSAHAVKTASTYGVSTGGGEVTVDMKSIKAQLDGVIQRIYDADDAPPALEELGITPVLGAAQFVDRKTLEVTANDGSKELLTAKKGIIIGTGAQPRRPNLPGLAEGDYLTYESVWALEVLPKKFAVIGGGPIGCELAQAFSRLGAKVTIIASKLLPNADGGAGAILAEAFAAEGIAVVAARAKAVSSGGGAAKVVTVEHADGTTSEVECDTLLLAVGRTPLTSSMALDRVGVALTPKGAIEVNSKLQTSVRGVYAAGDCTGDQQFTHYAATQGGLAAVNALFSFLGPLRYQGVFKGGEVPACTFTSPEVASVGLTEAQAKATLGDGAVKSITRPLSKVDGAIAGRYDEYGFIKLVFKAKSTELLGATIMAPAGGEMIAELTVALANKMKLSAMATVMHAYPSLSVGIQQCAAEVYYDSLDPYIALLGKIGL